MSEAPQAGQAITDAAIGSTTPAAVPPQAVAPAADATPQAAPQAAAPAESAAPAAQPEQPQQQPPEKYEFKAPDGVTLSDETVGKFSELAKDLKLPQDAAQRILGDMATTLQTQQQVALKTFYEGIGGMPDTWESQVRADKAIGGDKLAENLAVAARFRDTFGSPELKSLLDKTGLGNHPAMVKAFILAGKAISPDTFVSGNGSGSSSGKTLAERLYG